MNYLDILVRASISVPAAAKNVKLTNEAAQVGSALNASHRSCYVFSSSQRLEKINCSKAKGANILDF